jgi:hypothetical protein
MSLTKTKKYQKVLLEKKTLVFLQILKQKKPLEQVNISDLLALHKKS